MDDQGNPVPDCSSIPAAAQSLIEDATMYPFMTPFDVKLRTLTDDDARAACEMYPVGSPPLYQWTGGGGCSLSPELSTETPLCSLLMTAPSSPPLSCCSPVWRRRRPLRARLTSLLRWAARRLPGHDRRIGLGLRGRREGVLSARQHGGRTREPQGRARDHR